MNNLKSASTLCLSSLGLMASLLYAQPQQEMNASHAHSEASTEKSSSPSFTIEECIQYALQHSSDLKIQESLKASKELEHEIQNVAMDPSFHMSASKNFEDKEAHTTSMGLQQKWYGGWKADLDLSNQSANSGQDTLSRSITLSKALLKGGSMLETRKALDGSLYGMLKQNNNFAKEKRKLVYQIRKNAYGILKSMETLKIQNLRLERSKRILENAIERDEPMDIATAKLEVPSSEIQVLNVQININNALDGLKVEMGMDVTQELQLLPEWQFQLEEQNLENDIQWCIAHHEDFLNRALDIKRQQDLIKIAQRERWPSITLLGKLSDDSLDGFDNMRSQTRSLSMNFNWPIGARSERHALSLAKFQLEREQLEFEQMKQNKIRSLRRLARRLQQQKKSIDLQEKEVAMRELQVELYRDRWDEGEIDILELVRNQNALENSKVTLVTSKVSYLELLADYHYEIGRSQAF